MKPHDAMDYFRSAIRAARLESRGLRRAEWLHGRRLARNVRGLAGVVAVFLAGCSGPSIREVRVVDDVGMPIAEARVLLTYNVPYTVAIQEAVVTDATGYAAVEPYRLRKESFAMVTTKTEVISFTASQFGAPRDGVITLATWRGLRNRTPEAEWTDGEIHVPSIHLLNRQKNDR